MTPRIGNRFTPVPNRFGRHGGDETCSSRRATHNVLRGLVPIVAWAVASIALGVVVGFACSYSAATRLLLE